MRHALELFHSLTVREWLTAGADILIVYYFIYRTLLLIKGTRAAQMLIGIVLVGAGFFAAKLLELTTLSWLLDNLINYSIIFFIVIFQHDIRRGLMRVGQNLFAYARPYEQTSVFEEVIKATERLAGDRVGALIVLERDADLVDYLNEPGVEMDAKVSEELLVSIFLPDSENKLHDGAVIIKNLRIAQAGAVLPLTANARLDKALGTRHRAAIGVTEETDAVVVVVSEERGSISLCFGGNIARDLDAATLRKALLGLFQKQKRSKAPPKPKEREVPKALAELPFERPQPAEPEAPVEAAGDGAVEVAGDPPGEPAGEREASAGSAPATPPTSTVES
jgi:diadenylate cyclase